MIVLGIETSCDETAAAIVENGVLIKSSIISSQIEVHHPYGGVVPELAARKHIESIAHVTDTAIKAAGIGMDRIDGVAATKGPGLIGCLLVGHAFAKAFAFARKLPFIGVDHLAGHLYSVFLENETPEFPFIALMVSGGHTSLFHVTSHKEAELLGQTRDDAVGEAFDKVSKMLGLGYPGGAVIEKLAREGDPTKIPFPRSYLDKTKFDFSFSGLKTSVLRYLMTHDPGYQEVLPDIAAGFQEAAVDVLTYKLLKAAEKKKCAHVAVVGGVAANGRLRERVAADARKKGIAVYVPSLGICGDNAAMIAGMGFHFLMAGEVSELDEDVYSRTLY